MNIITRILMLLITFSVVFQILNYYESQAFKHHAALSTMKEAVAVSSVLDLNLRTRNVSGDVLLDDSEFEADVKRIFSKDINIPLKNVSYKFDYLKGSENELKAVKLKISDQKNTYRTTFVSNLATK